MHCVSSGGQAETESIGLMMNKLPRCSSIPLLPPPCNALCILNAEESPHQRAVELLRQPWDDGFWQSLANDEMGAKRGQAGAEVCHGLHQELGSEAWGQNS